MVLGDFNVARPEVEDGWVQPPWRDVWCTCTVRYGQARLGTLTSAITMDALTHIDLVEIDKILVSGPGADCVVRPTAVRLVEVPDAGVEVDECGSPIAAPVTLEVASDHFGVLAVLELVKKK